MSPRARRITLSGLVAGAAILFAARLLLARAVALPELGELPDFQLIDDRGALYSRSSMLGHATVVDFVFTSCATACPLLSAEMGRLQARVLEEGRGDRVQLLSISVDPERDTPERLHAFAAKYHADPSVWRFARGDEAAIRGVVVDGMKQEVARQLDRGEADGFTILHGTKLVLVDGSARIRGYYDAKDPESVRELQTSLAALADGRVETAPALPLPGLHPPPKMSLDSGDK